MTSQLDAATSNPIKKKYLPVFTGLRAVAAYMVFICHNPFSFAGQTVYYFCCQFFIGVSIFFVLSGFLITLRYENQLTSAKKTIKLYFRNRIARIYPMYFLLTSFTFCYYYFYNIPNKLEVITNHPLLGYAANITLLKGFFPSVAFTGILQAWTLTTEECFYLLAPIIFLLLKKYKFYWHIITLYSIGILLWFIFRHTNYYGFFNDLVYIADRTIFGRCFEFYIGLLLARLYMRGGKFPIIQKNYTLIGAISILVTLLLLTMERHGFKYAFYSTSGIVINNLLMPFAIVIFFWGLLHEDTWVSKILKSKLFEVLGKSSYTFYLIHLGVLNDLIFTNITHNNYYNFPILVIIAVFLHKYVETPLYRFIKKSY